MSNGFTNFGKEDLLTILTSNNYPNENVNEVLGSPQFVKNGSCDFYQTLIAEFPDLQILDLLPNNDKFLGYGNFTNSDGDQQGLIFLISDQLELQELNYLDSDGNFQVLKWLTTFDYNGNEINLPIFKKMKIDSNGYLYGIVQRPTDSDHPNYEYLWYLVKFNDFLSTYFNQFELFLIGDVLVSDQIAINNNTILENSYILNSTIFNISQNETNDDYYQIVYIAKKPTDDNPNLFVVTINVIDIQNGSFKILSDISLSNSTQGSDFIGVDSIQLEAAYDSTNAFYGSVLITNIAGIETDQVIHHTITGQEVVNWSGTLTNTYQSSSDGITYYSASTVISNFTNMTNIYNQYKNEDNFKFLYKGSSGSGFYETASLNWNETNPNPFSPQPPFEFSANSYQDEYTQTSNNYTAFGGSFDFNGYIVVSYNNSRNSININRNNTLSCSNAIIKYQIDFDKTETSISENGGFIISITQNTDTNYLVNGTIKQALSNNEADLTPQLINSSTGYISIQKSEDNSYGIYKFTTNTNSDDITEPTLLNSSDNFINTEPIYITTIKNQDVQETTIIGINNPDSKNVIGLNLYKKSNDLNPSQISFIQETFDADQPAFASVSGLRQQNKIFIFGFSENFATYCLFINEYNNGTPNSKPYFFLPYSNINSNFLLSRVQAQDSNAIVAADVNIEDNASVNNNFILNAVLEQYTMNNQDNSIWYIVNQSNNDVFYSDTTISKDIMEEKQVSFNVLISYINQTDNYTDSAFSIKLAQLYLNDEMTQDFLNQIYIKTMRLTFKNGSTQTLDIPWKIDLLTYEANADFTLELANSTNDLVKLEYLYADGSVNWTKIFSDANANKFIKIKSNIKFLESDNN